MRGIYRVLLLAYPRSFRRRFGEAMLGAFEEELREARLRPGALARATPLWHAVCDTLGTVIEMRWARWRGLPGAPLSRRETRLGWLRIRFRGSRSGGAPDPDRPFIRARRSNALDALLMDVKFAFRGLHKNPGFAAVAILTLALGIGASAAVFSVLEAVLLRPLPYEEPGRLVQLREVVPRNGQLFSIAPANLIDWQARNRVFTDIAPVSWVPDGYLNLAGGSEAARIPTHRVSSNFFDVLGVDAARGRTFVPDDDTPGAPPVAILSHGLWVRTFGADPDVVGRTIRLDDEPSIVIGVMPPDFVYLLPDFTGGAGPSLWMAGAMDVMARTERQAHTLDAVARLRPGVTVEQAQSEMDAIALALGDEHPRTNQNQRGKAWGVRVSPIHEYLVGELRSSLLVLSGAVGFVLLIAWVNVTNLLLARTSGRRRELAVRSAIGAGRWRVARQLLTETLLLSCLGGLAGLALARQLVALFVTTAPPLAGGPAGAATGAIPLLARAEISGWVLVMTLLTCLLTVAACGAIPAVGAARRNPQTGLLAHARDGRKRSSGGHVLVAVEVSLALVLLIGAGLLAATMSRISDVPLGFEPERAQVMRGHLTQERYATLSQGTRGTGTARWILRPEQTSLVLDVVEQLSELPGVQAAGAVNVLPIQGPGNYLMPVHVEGLAREPRRMNDGVAVHAMALAATITPAYFSAMGIPLLQGREFVPSDDRSAPAVAIVSEELIDRLELADPVGKTIMVRDGATWRTAEIVGVVGSVLQYGYYRLSLQMALDGRGPGLNPVYLPYSQPAEAYGRFRIGFHLTANFVVRHTADGELVERAMREVLGRADPGAPIAFTDSMDGYLAENLSERHFYMVLISVLAGVSLLLALIGVYGVMAFQVGQRVHEIGVRMALGAPAVGVVRMIVGEGSRVAVLGVLLGVAVAMAATRLLSNWLYGVSPTDPSVFIGLGGAMVGVTVLACLIPARRAALLDPIESLRAE